MSLALATKGILPDFTGTGTGSGETITEFVEGIIDVEVANDIITVETEEVEDIIEIALIDPDAIEIEIMEDGLTEDQLEIEVISDSTEITVEVV